MCMYVRYVYVLTCNSAVQVCNNPCMSACMNVCMLDSMTLLVTNVHANVQQELCMYVCMYVMYPVYIYYPRIYSIVYTNIRVLTCTYIPIHTVLRSLCSLLTERDGFGTSSFQ